MALGKPKDEGHGRQIDLLHSNALQCAATQWKMSGCKQRKRQLDSWRGIVRERERETNAISQSLVARLFLNVYRARLI